MKKTFIFLYLVSIFTLAITGCKKEEDKKDTPTPVVDLRTGVEGEYFVTGDLTLRIEGTTRDTTIRGQRLGNLTLSKSTKNISTMNAKFFITFESQNQEKRFEMTDITGISTGFVFNVPNVISGDTLTGGSKKQTYLGRSYDGIYVSATKTITLNLEEKIKGVRTQAFDLVAVKKP